MRLRRGLALAVVLVSGCSSFTSVTTTGESVDGGAIGADAAAAEDGATDAGVDTGVLTFVAGRSWSSPNGAKYFANDAGTVITGSLSHNHPLLYADSPLPLPSDDYTVLGTIVANSAAVSGRSEFGLVVRGSEDGGMAHVFGTDYGGVGRPFLAEIAAPLWNPDSASAALGTVAPVQLGQRYRLAVEVRGLQLRAKIWPDGTPEPDWQIRKFATSATGRRVGIYNYLANDALFESLSVTVP